MSWYLSCTARVGWLNRMTQFKDIGKNRDNASLGLYAYPVLMAADILLYHADKVPVGDDQNNILNLQEILLISLTLITNQITSLLPNY